jgi:hypothetical protein
LRSRAERRARTKKKQPRQNRSIHRRHPSLILGYIRILSYFLDQMARLLKKISVGEWIAVAERWTDHLNGWAACPQTAVTENDCGASS